MKGDAFDVIEVGLYYVGDFLEADFLFLEVQLEFGLRGLLCGAVGFVGLWIVVLEPFRERGLGCVKAFLRGAGLGLLVDCCDRSWFHEFPQGSVVDVLAFRVGRVGEKLVEDVVGGRRSWVGVVEGLVPTVSKWDATSACGC